jgi:hypothetical protein
VELVDEISNILINLIRFGAIFRIIVCCIKITVSEEDSTKFKKRIKSVIIFYIIAELIWTIKALIISYYG